MEAKHKQFIRRKLIPFILREHGRGFAMSTWCDIDLPVGEEVVEDGVLRRVPVCGTAACIGGSVNFIQNASNLSMPVKAGRTLGLTDKQAAGLFYYWEPDYQMNTTRSHCWPYRFAKRFERARTAWGKARVAVALLKEVMRTNGQCLENPHYGK